MTDPVIPISVTVYQTPDNSGNTANGTFGYVFEPDVVTVTEYDTTLCYALDADSAEQYTITGIYSTDSRFQLATPVVAADGRSVTVVNSNTQPQLIYVALQVVHKVSGRKLSLDPQVINVPPSNPKDPHGGH